MIALRRAGMRCALSEFRCKGRLRCSRIECRCRVYGRVHSHFTPILEGRIGESVAAETSGELTDGQLLERLAAGQEEACFTALLRRHGPMVLGVCQATFLVLFRRVRSLGRGSLASWLYTVADHVALKAKAGHARRQLRERQVVEMAHAQGVSQELWQDLQPVLDEELNRLPEKYRVPLVLCYLQARARRDVAKDEEERIKPPH